MKKAFGYGILASLFFAFTFIFNSSMNLSGGYWMWGASLRYLFMLPILALLLRFRSEDGFAPVFEDIRNQPVRWLVWSTVGFGLFYLPLTMASLYGESWLVAASWQLTIVAGVLLTPLFGQEIPGKNLAMSLIILAGIVVLQLPNVSVGDLSGSVKALIPIVIAAFSYPLGNRKMMQCCPKHIDTMQRVFGMTLCSMPFWLAVSGVALWKAGLPSGGQVAQSAVVAIFSGVIATVLFFHATDLVKENPRHLALIEATQCGEVIFTLIGGICFLGDSLPGLTGAMGLALVVGGMILNSLATSDPGEERQAKKRAPSHNGDDALNSHMQ